MFHTIFTIGFIVSLVTPPLTVLLGALSLALPRPGRVSRASRTVQAHVHP